MTRPQEWDAGSFRDWFDDELQRREWRMIDFARRLHPDAPMNGASIVSKWRSGKRQPDSRSCEAIADVFGVALDDVLAAAGHKPRGPVALDGEGELRARIHATIDRMRGPGLRAMSAMVETLYEQDIRAELAAKR